MCDGARVAHSSCPRASPGPGNRWNHNTTPASTPERMCNTIPLPDEAHHQQTPLWPTTAALGRTPTQHHQQPPRPPQPGPAPPAPYGTQRNILCRG